MTERILILRPDKAGDAIKTLPALRTAVQRLPEVEWHILCSTHNASLLEFEPAIRLHTLPRDWDKREKQDVYAELLRGNSQFPVLFDRTVNILCDSFSEVDRLLEAISSKKKYSVSSNALLPASFIPLKLPQNGPKERDESINIALLLEQAIEQPLVDHLPLSSPAPFLSDEDLTEARNKMGPKKGRWMGFCPFAGTLQRTHPLKNWKKFIHSATSEAAFDRFFLFGTPEDFSLLEDLRESAAQPDRTDVCFPSSFRTLGAYLKRLDCVVAVDSGPLHLAQSLQIPVLGILSGGDAARWCPPKTKSDHFLPRGLLNRYPAAWEMRRAFQNWLPSLS